MEALVYFLNKITPYSLKKFPYTVALNRVNKVITRKLTSVKKVWPRNSYVSGNLVCGISDLDLTIIFENVPSKSEFHTFINLYTSLKKVFPFLGEANIYEDTIPKEISKCANPFEIKRDPLLFNKISSSLHHHDHFDAAIFILRMLESDFINLQNNPDRRRRKWTSHYDSVYSQDLCSSFTLEIILTDLLRPITCSENNSKLIDEINNILSHKNTDDPYLLNLPSNDIFISLFPHCWIGASIINNTFAQDLEIVRTLPDWMKQFMLGQINWEIWGLWNQLFFISDYQHMISRLLHFQEVIVLLTPQANSIKTIDQLISKIKKFHTLN